MHSQAREADVLDRIDGGVALAERLLLVLILLLMVGLSTLQLVLRKFFDFGFEWADIMVRQMVLWLGFVGGALATHEGRHIAIDAVCRLVAPRKAALVRGFTFMVALVISGILVHASWRFIQAEIGLDSKVFGDVPTWPFQLIIPVSFAAIAFHFLVAARTQLLLALGRRKPRVEEPEFVRRDDGSEGGS